MKILITGGLGFIGTNLSDYFLDRGHSVIAVGRAAAQNRITSDRYRFISGDTTRPGHWQDALGDVVFIEAPKVGITVTADQEIGEVESTKATSTIYTPLSGKILRVNAELQDHPELVNQDPYGRGWIAVLEMSNPAEAEQLMTAGQYQEFLKTQSL